MPVLSDYHDQLIAPFPSEAVGWKPQAISRDRSHALLVAFVDARTVQARLDHVCPDDWQFRVRAVPEARLPTVQGPSRSAG